MNQTPFGHDPLAWRVSPERPTPGHPDRGNLTPRVFAGGPRTGFTNQNMTLAGSVLDDHWPGTTVTSWWSQIAGPGSAVIEDAGFGVVVVNFPDAGSYVLRLTATDGLQTASDETSIEVIPRPYDSWRETYFTEAELGQETISSVTANPDLDRLSNGEEYFFATDPRVFEAREIFETRVVNDHFEVEWIQRADAPDVTVIPERAGPLYGHAIAPNVLKNRLAFRPGMLQLICIHGNRALCP